MNQILRPGAYAQQLGGLSQDVGQHEEQHIYIMGRCSWLGLIWLDLFR